VVGWGWYDGYPHRLEFGFGPPPGTFPLIKPFCMGAYECFRPVLHPGGPGRRLASRVFRGFASPGTLAVAPFHGALDFFVLPIGAWAFVREFVTSPTAVVARSVYVFQSTDLIFLFARGGWTNTPTGVLLAAHGAPLARWNLIFCRAGPVIKPFLFYFPVGGVLGFLHPPNGGIVLGGRYNIQFPKGKPDVVLSPGKTVVLASVFYQGVWSGGAPRWGGPFRHNKKNRFELAGGGGRTGGGRGELRYLPIPPSGMGFFGAGQKNKSMFRDPKKKTLGGRGFVCKGHLYRVGRDGWLEVGGFVLLRWIGRCTPHCQAFSSSLLLGGGPPGWRGGGSSEGGARVFSFLPLGHIKKAPWGLGAPRPGFTSPLLFPLPVAQVGSISRFLDAIPE
jgi:hypothetical protein